MLDIELLVPFHSQVPPVLVAEYRRPINRASFIT